MSDYKFSFVHDGLSSSEFDALSSAVKWLIQECPAYSGIPGIPFPTAPLCGQLITASFIAEAAGASKTWRNIHIFRHDGTDSPIRPVRDERMIVLNGRKSFGADYLTIGRNELASWQTIDTQGLPYTLLVAATLILANHFSSSWSIASSAPDDVWPVALAWVQDYDSTIQLPASLAPTARLGTGLPLEPRKIDIPSELDCRP